MVSVNVTKDVEDIMLQFNGVNWSSVASQAISKKAQELAFLKHFSSESELTEDDAIELGHKVNKTVAKKYRS